ncbi:cag pathogenicity island Cag12 family protein [Pantoea stewartii]|uniref:cag pathogenicity island Cag12 family protein n=1 Tax=Pantoea stewartii TaxID=66269 RepID=UPI0025A3065C|nr:cag pathogenicity island Cag12 family protein [Pantoea stewartii]
MKKCVLFLAFLAAACSSPPEPPQVNWQGYADVVNGHAIGWHASRGVIKSDNVMAKWSQSLHGFTPENRLYDDAVFYAVAHSDRVIIVASNGNDYFVAKRWLREHGATGVIEFQNRLDCFGIKNTDIYFQRR